MERSFVKARKRGCPPCGGRGTRCGGRRRRHFTGTKAQRLTSKLKEVFSRTQLTICPRRIVHPVLFWRDGPSLQGEPCSLRGAPSRLRVRGLERGLALLLETHTPRLLAVSFPAALPHTETGPSGMHTPHEGQCRGR
ncbi:hypothetical protein AOLI_G00190400 [Acnodon oligacanthus]